MHKNVLGACCAYFDYVYYSYYYNYDRPKNIPIFVLALCMLALMLFMIYKTVVYREKGESADYETAGEI